MRTVHLKHHPVLNYLPTAALRRLPETITLATEYSSLFSFRRLAIGKPDLTLKKVHAGMRPLDIYTGGSYCFYGLQSDSPLAPLFLWDAAHFLTVGEQITIIEDTTTPCFLDREYFNEHLKCTSRSAQSVTYTKVARLPAETDDDLDSWTFGLPVGPEDATVLNAVVKRILDLDIPNKEILLCGIPGSNFAYFDRVRIIGEDITAPPVQICKKKNRLAQEATYNNLVILHDRVLLPLHFGEIVRRYGPRYPLVALQSLFFDNRACLHPRRYSDFCVAAEGIGEEIKGLHRLNQNAVTFTRSTMVELNQIKFPLASAMRYSNDTFYPTGSLYICRKEVWNLHSLDEALFWTELEDVEFGIRCSKAGIPTRINTLGITQTITSRALLGCDIEIELGSGKIIKAGPNRFSILRKKPLLRMTSETALSRLQLFASKYINNDQVARMPTGIDKISPSRWVTLINKLVHQSTFSNDIDSVSMFINDFEKWVLMDQMPDSMKHDYMQCFLNNPAETKRLFIVNAWPIKNMVRQRPLQTWFLNTQADYFHCKALSLPGIAVTAVQLYINNGKRFHFESFIECFRAIYNSTPFTLSTKKIK